MAQTIKQDHDRFCYNVIVSRKNTEISYFPRFWGKLNACANSVYQAFPPRLKAEASRRHTTCSDTKQVETTALLYTLVICLRVVYLTPGKKHRIWKHCGSQLLISHLRTSRIWAVDQIPPLCASVVTETILQLHYYILSTIV